jgi:hypothetical protein
VIGLLDAVKVIAALFVPVVLLIVNHVLSLVTFQLTFDIILKVAVLLSVEFKFKEVDETVKVSVSNFDIPPPQVPNHLLPRTSIATAWTILPAKPLVEVYVVQLVPSNFETPPPKVPNHLLPIASVVMAMTELLTKPLVVL